MSSHKPEHRKRRPPESRSARADPDQLAHGEELFALEYLANQGNGAAAYRASHPKCRSGAAAAVGAVRMLRISKVQKFIEREQAARRKRLRMDGDEALYLVSCDARSDIRELFDQEGRLLPMHRWPDSIAVSIKTINHGPSGTKIVLNDKLAARRIILEQTGKLKSRVEDDVDALAEAMRSNLERHAK
jgi:phage terminase small subunit